MASHWILHNTVETADHENNRPKTKINDRQFSFFLNNIFAFSKSKTSILSKKKIFLWKKNRMVTILRSFYIIFIIFGGSDTIYLNKVQLKTIV